MHVQRDFEKILLNRLKERPRFIQVLLGPRQVGKTSGVLNVLENNFSEKKYNYFLIEESFYEKDWFLNQIQKAIESNKKIIVLDEIQKLDHWSEAIKLIWDRLKHQKKQIHFVLLGSSSLKLTLGLSESLSGRFEMIPCYHWSYHESKHGFKLSFEQYHKMGGYPGSYPLIKDEHRFKSYIINSIFETSVQNDILRFAHVKKPALFRQTFQMICQFPAQVVSYNKLLGQLQDLGNVDQVKYYLDLYAQAYFINLIPKWTRSPLSRATSPKIIIGANVFPFFLSENQNHTEEFLGHLFENLVGNQLCQAFETVYYWAEGAFELDFIVLNKGTIYGIEVKSQRRKAKSLIQFRKKFHEAYTCIITLENYLEFEQNPMNFMTQYSI
jgi:predicted AAA+ superfamily ATPase